MSAGNGISTVLVIGRPDVEIVELKDKENFSFTVEVDVRPEISLPNFSQIKIPLNNNYLKNIWSGRRDSNPRSPAPKAGALATTLRPEG